MVETYSRDEVAEKLAELMPSMKRLARPAVRDRPAVEDIAQDTIPSVWKAAIYGRVKKLPAYAGRAAWIKALRYRSRRKHWIPRWC
jgi:DNA-directed RNA polymerase specialized sigma24 family protein